MIYQPDGEELYRVTWYGGDSNMLHFQKYQYILDIDHEPERSWVDRNASYFMSGLPETIHEMLIVMEDHLHNEMILEQERIYQLL